MSKTKQMVQVNPVSRSKENLSSQTITTARAISLQPVLVHDILPGDSFNVKMEQFNRVDALPVSSFIQFKNRNVAFYVKNCQVWKPFDAFKTGAPYAFGYQNVVPTKKPFLTPFDLFFLFVTDNALVSDVDTTDAQDSEGLKRMINNHECDFAYVIGNNLYAKQLRARGRAFYKVLYQLGYRMPSFIDFSADLSQMYALEMSLLPLMSYMSVIVNYYVPLKWRSYQFVNSMSYLVDPVPQHLTADGDSPSVELRSWFTSVFNICTMIYYGDDYFTSSLVEPLTSPNGQGTYFFPGMDNEGTEQSGIVQRDGVVLGQPAATTVNVGSVPDSYTQYLIYALSCVTGQAQLSAMTLNDVKAATLAKFGYKAESADMVPYILDKVDDTINVVPEMSMADTYNSATKTGAPIGFKAGSGQGTAQLKGNYKFDNYGTLLFVNSIMPAYFYYHGIRRPLLRVSQEEEYDRNYTKLGYQAIARAELDIDINNPLNTFGFTRKYADYAKGNDILGGDFVINSANAGLEAFHFGRNVRTAAENDAAFSLATNGDETYSRFYRSYDGGQYNRVFVSSETDPIQQWYLFDIKATRQIDSGMTIGEFDGEVIETKPVGATLNS